MTTSKHHFFISIALCAAFFGCSFAAIAKDPSSSRSERGELVHRIVSKWGGTVQNRYRMNVDRWAQSMVPLFASASLPQLRKAAMAQTFDGMNLSLIEKPGAALSGQGGKLLGDPHADYVFTPVEPCRLADTRLFTQPLAAGSTTSFLVTGGMFHSQGGGACQLPSGVGAVMLSVTAVQPDNAGFLTLYPEHLPIRPFAANVNYAAGQVINNQTVVGLFSYNSGNLMFNDKVKLYTYARMHVVIDIVGVFRNAQRYLGQLTCQDVVKTTSAVGETRFKVDLQCPMFHSMTAILCNATNPDAPFPEVADLQVQGSDIKSASGFDYGYCFYKNGAASSVTTKARCCQESNFR
ncbi:MAG: hypothetical protein KF800_10995 [Lysobacter sp.]|nr:hypothetical protein [Lysobacter sp.]